MKNEDIKLSSEQKKARRSRNIAIGLLLLLLIIVFYIVTILKFGPQLPDPIL